MRRRASVRSLEEGYIPEALLLASPKPGRPARKDVFAGGLTQLFDNLLTQKPTDDSSLNRSRTSRSGKDNSRSGGKDKDPAGAGQKQVLGEDLRNSCTSTQSLPWHGQGVPPGLATPANLSSQGTGWRSPLNPLGRPKTPAQKADANLIASYEESRGQATANKVVMFAELGTLSYLGEGEFATAHATKLHGERLAVKMLKPEKREVPAAVDGIKREIILMNLMRHPNILLSKAMGEHEGIPFVVLEVLSSVLAKDLPRPGDDVPFWVRQRDVKAWPLSRAFSYGAQLAAALKYCHDDAFPGYRVVHRDIKPNNIGFVADGRLVLFDFGLASLWKLNDMPSDELPRKLTGETGSLRYMAPEVALYWPYTHRSEVFSFALVLWEMCAHEKPFSSYTSEERFKKALQEGVVPPIGKRWPAGIGTLLLECWRADEAKRPEFRALVPRLESLRDAALESEADASAGGGCFGRKTKPKVSPAPIEAHSLN